MAGAADRLGALGPAERRDLLDAVEARLPEWGYAPRAVLGCAAAGALAHGDPDEGVRFAARILPRIDFAAQLRRGTQVRPLLFAEAWTRRLGYRFLIERVHRRFLGERPRGDEDRLLGFLERLERQDGAAEIDLGDPRSIEGALRDLFAQLDAAGAILRHFGDHGDEAAVLDVLAREERRRLFARLRLGFALSRGDEAAWILDALAQLLGDATVVEAAEVAAWTVEIGALRTRARLFADLPDLERRRLLGVCEGAVADFGAGRLADATQEIAALGRLMPVVPRPWADRFRKAAASALEASEPGGILRGAHAALARFAGTRRLEDADASALVRKGSLYALLQFLAEHDAPDRLGPWMRAAAGLIDVDAGCASALNAVDGAVGAVVAMARRAPDVRADAEGLLWRHFDVFRSAAPDLIEALGPRPAQILRYVARLDAVGDLARGEQEGLLRLLLRLGGDVSPRG